MNFKKEDELLNYLEKYSNEEYLIIAVDGYDGSGKTYLSKTIYNKFKDFAWIDFDDYRKNKKANYIESLNIPLIKSKIFNQKKIIFSGICMLQILEKIKINNFIHIYIKKYNEFGWADKDDCCFLGKIEDYIKKEVNDMNNFYKLSGESDKVFKPIDLGIRPYLIKYHQRYKPHESSKIIFKRLEKDLI